MTQATFVAHNATCRIVAPAVQIDPLSALFGFAAAFPAYWFLDNFAVPRLAHLLYVARRSERV